MKLKWSQHAYESLTREISVIYWYDEEFVNVSFIRRTDTCHTLTLCNRKLHN